MPNIKPRPLAQKERIAVRVMLTKEHESILKRYGAFIGESSEYVIGQLIDLYLAKDKDFIAAGPTSARLRSVKTADEIPTANVR